MDRRSWLWRRKSSDKTPGETESSGSLSSHSERFSDEQAGQAHSSPSREVTSKAGTTDEEPSASVKALTEKLTATLLNVSAKEELVKQHAKVAEEAVSGWEKAEAEVLALKQQLEAAGRKNSVLEDRVGQLDGALKECLRQLRQAKEEQGQKIEDAITKKAREWELEKTQLESQLADLRTQLQSAQNATASVHHELHPKFEALEKENSGLRLELLSRLEELELRTIERDLSTQAAETASKQHLEDIKKLSKLEAECQRLKNMIRKSTSANDHKSFTTSLNHIESSIDTQSDSSERLITVKNDTRKVSNFEPRHTDFLAAREIVEQNQIKHKKFVGNSLIAHTEEIDLMNDFLEMEQLAALSETDVGNSFLGTGSGSDSQNYGEVLLKEEIQVLTQRTADLEEKLEKAEAEKLKIEMALTESERKVEALQNQIKETEGKLSKLAKLEADNMELERTLARYQKELDEWKNQAREAEENFKELRKTKAEKLEIEASLTGTQKQIEIYKNQLKDAEEQLVELQTLLGLATNEKNVAEQEAKDSVAKREVAESRLRDVEAEVESLSSKISSLEEEKERERLSSAKHLAKCQELQDEISKLKNDIEHQRVAGLQHSDSFDCDIKMKQDRELAIAASKFAECQRTIASLGQQLKSLATLEDFLYESEESLDGNSEGLPHPTSDWRRWDLNAVS